MIRLTYLLRRKPELTFEEFQHYWLETHGPLVAKNAATLGVRRYVQVHALTNPATRPPPAARGEMAISYDGVAELWFENRESILEGPERPEVQEAAAELLEDERNFIDLPHSCGWYAYEVPQINPTPEDIVATPESDLVKLFYVIRQLPGQSLEDAQFYWRVHHGPLVRKFGQVLRIQRYIQVHRLEDELNEMFAASRGLEPPSTSCGHAELWYDRTAEPGPANEAMIAQDALVDDERKFIDFPNSVMWFNKEHVIVGG